VARFANERAYDAIIDAALTGAPAGVTRALVQAMIGTESAFKPKAYRAEPHIQDASRGLMQILLRTARGVGFTGQPLELYDPATNIRYGVAYLADLVRAKGGNVWTAVSAYNNGSGKIAASPTTVCLARDQVTGVCVRSYTAQPGQYLNQPYVDKVKALYQYFAGGVATAGGGGPVALLVLLALVFGRVVRGA